jgi:tetratricopeptide (TPR) repeat protein
LFRLAAVILVPATVFGLLELALRVFGFGYPTAFWVPGTVDGKPVYLTNDYFGQRFFPPGLDREPGKQVIAADKAPGAYRVFVLGESAARGTPVPAYSFSRVLEVMLRDRYPGVRFEVVNTGMAAINSHVVLPIAEDCAGHQPDLFVVYMGNNEVVGPYGPAGVLGPFAQSRGVVRASIRAKTTRVGQLVDRLVRAFRAGPETSQWGGMEMFENSQMSADDPRLPAVYDYFARNLRAIIQTGKAGSARVVVCTVASNLADSAPFGSSHAPELSAGRLAEWDRVCAEAVRAASAGEHAAAVAKFEQAAGIDSVFADLQFRWAKSLAALNRWDKAREHFSRARDLDTLRFRADSRINDAIRAEAGAAGVRLVDMEQAMAAEAPGGVAGAELFYEHVHFTFHGNYVLARSVFDAVVEGLPDWVQAKAVGIGRPVPEAECGDRLAWTDMSRLEAVEKMRQLISKPPFTRQLNFAEQLAALDRQRDALRDKVRAPGAAARMLDICRRAVDRNPDDVFLLNHLASALLMAGDLDGALTVYQNLAGRAPYWPDPHNSIGLLFASRGRFNEAEAEYRAAIKINPRFFQAHSNLGRLLLETGRLAEADAALAEALRLNPDFVAARLARAHLRTKQGRPAEAEADYVTATQADPDNPEANVALGMLAVQRSDAANAEAHFRAALRSNPDLVQAHIGLALLLAGRGAVDEARTHVLEAARLQPGNPNVMALVERLGAKLPAGK